MGLFGDVKDASASHVGLERRWHLEATCDLALYGGRFHLLDMVISSQQRGVLRIGAAAKRCEEGGGE